MRHVWRQNASWADHACLLVGLLEITLAERDQPTHLPGIPLTYSDSSWSAPLDKLVRQVLGPLTVASRCRDNGLDKPARPRQGLVTVGLADLDRFFNQLLGFIPVARLEIVVAQLDQRDDARCDCATTARVVDDAPKGISTPFDPGDVGGRSPDPDDLGRVQLANERCD